MSIIDEIRQDANGAAILKDWLGEGVPVRQEHANGRALVCLRGNAGGACPHHKEPNWWERTKHIIAAVIQQHIAMKNRLNLSTPYDDKLAMCVACGCALPVKVWVPIKHIAAHTKPETFEKMPEFCWQRREADYQPFQTVISHRREEP